MDFEVAASARHADAAMILEASGGKKRRPRAEINDDGDERSDGDDKRGGGDRCDDDDRRDDA
ncbi:MAG: hypothetical protein ACYC5H_13490 [Methylovirgula sp.]|nr:hypothetical protein [Hyphomicrobium sp.]